MLQNQYILQDPTNPDSKRIKRKEVEQAQLEGHRNELPIKVESADLISSQHIASADEYLEDFSGMFSKVIKKGQMTKNEIRSTDIARTHEKKRTSSLTSHNQQA
jgi:hypothetical protein